MKTWLENFNDCEEMVKKVLSKLENTRSDDRALEAVIWSLQGFKMTKEQYKAFRRCFSAETISRARRKIQEKGMFMPVKEVYEQRGLLDDKIGDYLKK